MKYLLHMIVQIFFMRKRETWWRNRKIEKLHEDNVIFTLHKQGTNNKYEETEQCGSSVKNHCGSSSDCFCWKAWTPYSVHELTKSRKKHGTSPFSINLISEPFSTVTLESRKEKKDILFTTWNQIYPQQKTQNYSWIITSRPHLWLELFNYAYLWSLPPVLHLFKSRSRVCTLQMVNMSSVLKLLHPTPYP
jgi:hypothetical protein